MQHREYDLPAPGAGCGWLTGMPEETHFTSTLATKRMAADCLFRDRADRLLVLEPTYKPTWDMPGGVVEAGESPRRAAQREVREELGLDMEPGELIAVDWISRNGDFTELVAFLFDGGVLTPTEIDQIVVDPSEVRGYRFVSLDEAGRLLDAEQFARVVTALTAGPSASTVYLENGYPPGSAVLT